MNFNNLRHAFEAAGLLKARQIEREIHQQLSEMERRRPVQFVPFIPRTQPTIDDEDVVTLEAARDLARWFYQ